MKSIMLVPDDQASQSNSVFNAIAERSNVRMFLRMQDFDFVRI